MLHNLQQLPIVGTRQPGPCGLGGLGKKENSFPHREDVPGSVVRVGSQSVLSDGVFLAFDQAATRWL